MKVSNTPHYTYKAGDIVRHKRLGTIGLIIAERSVISLLQRMVLVDGDVVGWWIDSVEAINESR